MHVQFCICKFYNKQIYAHIWIFWVCILSTSSLPPTERKKKFYEIILKRWEKKSSFLFLFWWMRCSVQYHMIESVKKFVTMKDPLIVCQVIPSSVHFVSMLGHPWVEITIESIDAVLCIFHFFEIWQWTTISKSGPCIMIVDEVASILIINKTIHVICFNNEENYKKFINIF